MVKIGVIGLGIIGIKHLEYIKESENTELAGVSTRNEEVLNKYTKEYNVPGYKNYTDLLADKNIEAVLIAVPHYYHRPIIIEAFNTGLHVLTEKPVGVHVNDVKKMIDAYNSAKKKNPNLVFAAMFQQRALARWRKIKEIVSSGELGSLARVTWIITDSFRTQAYYDLGTWRASWKGEGGGVLINQSSHQLDLYTWFFGLPEKIAGFAGFGKFHDIEVEDDVTIVMHHSNGMTTHFITNTAESPGTNRLEIVGEMGKLVYEENKLVLYKNKVSMFDNIKNCKDGFMEPDFIKEEIPFDKDQRSPYTLIIENFGEAVEKGGDLIAPAVEGINSVEISNGVILSHFAESPVRVPIDGKLFEKKLHELIEKSKRT